MSSFFHYFVNKKNNKLNFTGIDIFTMLWLQTHFI